MAAFLDLNADPNATVHSDIGRKAQRQHVSQRVLNGLRVAPSQTLRGVIRPGATGHAGEGRQAVATMLEGHGFIEA
jgi:hypothetical protein